MAITIHDWRRKQGTTTSLAELVLAQPDNVFGANDIVLLPDRKLYFIDGLFYHKKGLIFLYNEAEMWLDSLSDENQTEALFRIDEWR